MSSAQLARGTLRADLAQGGPLITVHVDDVSAVLERLDELEAIEKRLNDAERWTRGAGEFEKSVGQREAVRWALYGEVPS